MGKTRTYQPTEKQLIYSGYLESGHWKQLRRAKLEQAGHKCQSCNRNITLQVHHIRYKNLFDVTLDDLVILCDFCHSILHDQIKKRGENPEKEISEIKKLLMPYVINREKDSEKDRSKLKTGKLVFAPPVYIGKIGRKVKNAIKRAKNKQFNYIAVDILIKELQQIQSQHLKQNP